MAAPDDYVVDFKTLWVVPAWIQHHCRIPDGFYKGHPFEMADYQLWCTLNHYRVRPDARPAGTRLDDGQQVMGDGGRLRRKCQRRRAWWRRRRGIRLGSGASDQASHNEHGSGTSDHIDPTTSRGEKRCL